jgi:hypothetical protein
MHTETGMTPTHEIVDELIGDLVFLPEHSEDLTYPLGIFRVKHLSPVPISDKILHRSRTMSDIDFASFAASSSFIHLLLVLHMQHK